ncbi:dihydrodipicolinate synthase, partial [Halomonas sp. SUBG004]
MNEQGIHEQEFIQLVARLAHAKVDSIGVLGSTGSYAYLSVEERARVAKLSVENAAGGAGGGGHWRAAALAMCWPNAEHAQQAGASGLLLA